MRDVAEADEGDERPNDDLPVRQAATWVVVKTPWLGLALVPFLSSVNNNGSPGHP